VDTILAVGAHGECPERLHALLEAAGFPVPDLGGGQQLTSEVMYLVLQAQAELGIAEPEELSITVGGETVIVKGTFVGQATWDALRARAAARTGLLEPAKQDSPPATSAAVASAASTGDASGDARPGPEGVAPGEAAAQAEAAAAAEQTGAGTVE
jgi:hypothetical protein